MMMHELFILEEDKKSRKLVWTESALFYMSKSFFFFFYFFFCCQVYDRLVSLQLNEGNCSAWRCLTGNELLLWIVRVFSFLFFFSLNDNRNICRRKRWKTDLHRVTSIYPSIYSCLFNYLLNDCLFEYKQVWLWSKKKD